MTWSFGENRRAIAAAAGALGLAGALLGGCNAFSFIESESDREELIASAQAKMDQGDCKGAVDILDPVGEGRDDKMNQILGWAHLCTAGATVNKVAKSLFSYSSDTNNLTVFGTLADNLIPCDDAKLASIDKGIRAFEKLTASNSRQFNVAFGYIVRSAGVLAAASTDKVKARRSDVAPTGCLNSDCAAGGAGCTAGMKDIDALAVGAALDSAALAVGGVSGLDKVKDLASRLGDAGNAAVANSSRCAIFNKMLVE